MQSGTTSQRSDATLLGDLAPGKARLLLTEDVNVALESLEFAWVEFDGSLPIIVISWSSPQRIDLGIDSVVHQMSEAALAAWPDWTPGIDRRWRDAAEELVRAGKLPAPLEYPPASQVKNLSAVLPANPIVLLVLEDDLSLKVPEDPRLDGLCRTASWLARHADVRVGVLVNKTLGRRSEFSSIDYEPVLWPVDRLDHDGGEFTASVAIERRDLGIDFHDPPFEADRKVQPGAENRKSSENKLRFWPILDRPHPNSPGEQALAKALSEDSELAGLFRFNQLFTTSEGHRYIVDLLNSQDRIVIEVDGYRHHCSRFAFNADRRRDYHLFLTGFAVLRVPHEEVVQDVNAVMQRIRRFVDCRRKESGPAAIADDHSTCREGKRTSS